MNLTPSEGVALVDSFTQAVSLTDSVEVGVCPPYLSIPAVHHALEGTAVVVGAQDVHWMPKGAFTGSISANMLQAAGVHLCIIGHSETRGRFGKLEIPESTIGYFAETDETVNLKLKALLFANIVPVLCVGETLAEREAGNTDGVIASQLEGALAGLEADELFDLVVAYEPVWAIGTGKTCDTPEAQRVCATIRTWLSENCSSEVAAKVRVLYGGSVKASNARELFSQPDIDGGLVGGASLDPTEFAAVVKAAS